MARCFAMGSQKQGGQQSAREEMGTDTCESDMRRAREGGDADESSVAAAGDGSHDQRGSRVHG